MPIPLYKYNQSRLKDDLKIRGLNHSSFARASGVSRLTILRFIQSGECNQVTMARIAFALGYPVERYIPEQRRRQLAKLPKVRRAPSPREMAAYVNGPDAVA